MGYNGNDNGHAIFNYVRIPRGDMLMHYTSVARDGTYSTVPSREKLLYGGILQGRGVIVRTSLSIIFIYITLS
jgi:acyl-CoA oxidase